MGGGGDLHRATPAVTRDLGFCGLIRRTASSSRHLRQATDARTYYNPDSRETGMMGGVQIRHILQCMHRSYVYMYALYIRMGIYQLLCIIYLTVNIACSAVCKLCTMSSTVCGQCTQL